VKRLFARACRQNRICVAQLLKVEKPVDLPVVQQHRKALGLTLTAAVQQARRGYSTTSSAWGEERWLHVETERLAVLRLMTTKSGRSPRSGAGRGRSPVTVPN